MEQNRNMALELFDKAMDTEREGIKIYEDAAAKTKSREAAEIFRILAEAEKSHLSIIKNTKEDVERTYSSGTWKGGFAPKIDKEIETIGRQFIPKLSGEVVSASALDAINVGIKVEQDSISFYSDAITKVSDQGVANMFNLLLIAERLHLLLLEMHKSYIQHPRRD